MTTLSDVQQRLRQAVAEEVQRRDLANWMRTHRAELTAMLRDAHMDWEAVAEQFRRAQLLVNGQPPAASTAQAVWRQVQKKNSATKER